MFPSNIESVLTHVSFLRNIYVIVPQAILDPQRRCTKATFARRLPFYSDGCHDSVVGASTRAAASHGRGIYFVAEESFGAFNLSARAISTYLPAAFHYRATWYLQQFLKLYAHRLISGLGDHVLLDSDVIFERPHDFVAKVNADGHARYKYETSPLLPDERNYFRTIDCLTNGRLRRIEARSGIVDMIVVSLRVLRELFTAVESLHRATLWVAVMRCVQSLGYAGTQSDFSEFELYFQFARQTHPATMHITPNRSSSRSFHGWSAGRGG